MAAGDSFSGFGILFAVLIRPSSLLGVISLRSASRLHVALFWRFATWSFLLELGAFNHFSSDQAAGCLRSSMSLAMRTGFAFKLCGGKALDSFTVQVPANLCCLERLR